MIASGENPPSTQRERCDLRRAELQKKNKKTRKLEQAKREAESGGTRDVSRRRIIIKKTGREPGGKAEVPSETLPSPFADLFPFLSFPFLSFLLRLLPRLRLRPPSSSFLPSAAAPASSSGREGPSLFSVCLRRRRWRWRWRWRWRRRRRRWALFYDL
jgi:hypothetical protein